MNQYIITEEQLREIDGTSNDELIFKEVRSHPYQSERDKVLTDLHNWFENYCEGNEEADLWMAFIKAERAIRQKAGEP